MVAIHHELLARGVDHELTLVGDTPPLPDSVRGVGRVGLDALAELYATSHVLLEPARGNASGITLTDAANFGLPAVATDTGGVSTIVQHEQSGLLLPGDDEDGMASLGAEAVVEVGSRWVEMGEAAKRRAQLQLNWEAWASAAVDTLERVSG